MKNMIKNLFIFVSGAGFGAAVTWKLLKTKYEQIAQDEIDSVKEVYSKQKDNADMSKHAAKLEKPLVKCVGSGRYPWGEETTPEYNDLADIYRPSTDWTQNLLTDTNKDKKEDVELKNKPYVISPDEFGETGYTTESLTYYEDGVLTDDFDNVIENVEDMVGKDSLTHFGEYEDDSVFVRNDNHKIDYEILLDTRSFSTLKNLNGDDE